MPTHPGIIVCTENRDDKAYAGQVDAAIREPGTLTDRLIKVVQGIPA